MNFLVDAQLPRRMTTWLTAAGCDAVHTLDLPDGNRTTDAQINDVADREQRVVVTKDADFVDAHLVRSTRPGSGATNCPPAGPSAAPAARSGPSARGRPLASQVSIRPAAELTRGL